jgi:large subunit ribosomal protein L13
MERERVLFDADNQVAGRLASKAAKEALKGKLVFIVNAEKAVILGNPRFVIKRYHEMVSRGDPYHGPFYPKMPDRMLRRMIRGMLPFSVARGREAFRRVRVYTSVPAELSKQSFSKPGFDNASQKFIELGNLAVRVGAKKTW